MTIHITKEIEDAYKVYVDEVIDAGFTGQPIRRRDTYQFMHGNTFIGLVDFAAGYNSADRKLQSKSVELGIVISNLEMYISKMRDENLRLSEKLANSYVTPPDNGPWVARAILKQFEEDKIVIESCQFSTDTALVVAGDFYDQEHKLNYSKSLAHWMNQALEKEKIQGRATELLNVFSEDVGVHHSGNLSSVEYPSGDVVGPCVCGSWPGGKCLNCDKIKK